LFLTLEAIPEEKRRPERELWSRLDEARSRILGALLSAVSEGLKNIERVKLPRLPRMADFALWSVACEPALWVAGTFMEVYERNRREIIDSVLEADAVAGAVQAICRSSQCRS
jgi:hypothetical protein